MTKTRAIKLIGNCKRAFNRCRSDWGKNYWSQCEKELRIKYKHLLQENI